MSSMTSLTVILMTLGVNGMRLSSPPAPASSRRLVRERAAKAVDAACAKALQAPDVCWVTSIERGPSTQAEWHKQRGAEVARAYEQLAERGLAPTYGTASIESIGDANTEEGFAKLTEGLSLSEALSSSNEEVEVEAWASSPAAVMASACLLGATQLETPLAVAETPLAAGLVVAALLNLRGRFGRRPEVTNDRVCAHEAGHLLAAWLFGVPCLATSLSPAEALLRGPPLAESAPCSIIAGKKDEQLEERLVVLMAGIAAEALLFGDAKTGRQDEMAFEALSRSSEMTQPEALARAAILLRRHAAELDRVRAHLAANRGLSIGATMLAIDDTDLEEQAVLTAAAAAAAASNGKEEEEDKGLMAFLRKQLVVVSCSLLALTGGAVPALAMSEEFEAVQAELKGQGLGGVKRIENDLAQADFRDLNTFTKFYDLDFRKNVMGTARKTLPKEAPGLRDEAQLLMNGVTFDLIGINKAVRKEGSEDPAEAARWFTQMKVDVKDFIALEAKATAFAKASE